MRGNAYVAANLSVAGNLFTTNNIYVSNVYASGKLDVEGIADFDSNVYVHSNIINDRDIYTGNLEVTHNIVVNGNSYFTGNLNSSNITNLGNIVTDNIYVDKIGYFNGNTYFMGNLSAVNIYATSNISGVNVNVLNALRVDGEANIKGLLMSANALVYGNLQVGNANVVGKFGVGGYAPTDYQMRVNGNVHMALNGNYDINHYGVLTITTADSDNTAQLALVRKDNYVWKMGYRNDGTNDLYIYDGMYGTKLVAGNAQNWASVSDRRFKKNIEEIEGALAKIREITGVYYNYLDDLVDEGIGGSGRKVGVIAQDVLKVLPEAVDVPHSEEMPITIRYSELIPLLINGLKEIDSRLEKMESRLEKMEIEGVQKFKAGGYAGPEITLPGLDKMPFTLTPCSGNVQVNGSTS
jgi:Chaperone of endosialidase